MALGHQPQWIPRRMVAFEYPSKTFASATRRDAPMPPLTNPVENAIEEARRRGEFKNLSNAGKPLPKKDDVMTAVGGNSPSDLLSKKAEFEMRRAIRNNELESLAGEGQQLRYRGTTPGLPPAGQGSGGAVGGRASGVGADVMSQYILDQSQVSAEDLKQK